MNWKLKARIQHAVSQLPAGLSYAVNYTLQRYLGELRDPDPILALMGGAAIADNIVGNGQSVESKTILEIGTGLRLNVPLALWLCGASRVVTVDLNPYLKPKFVMKDVSYIRGNRGRIIGLFGKHAEQPIFQERFNCLCRTCTDIDTLIKAANIQYLAPADAAHLDLESRSIDCHVSHTVFEHIPPDIILAILAEGKRVVKEGGLFIHDIDFSDHFSMSDPTITAINFLQFSEAEWKRYSDNRYAYVNRLRIDDFVELFGEAGLEIVSVNSHIDPRAAEALARGFPLDERFREKAPDVIATAAAWFVAKARRAR